MAFIQHRFVSKVTWVLHTDNAFAERHCLGGVITSGHLKKAPKPRGFNSKWMRHLWNLPACLRPSSLKRGKSAGPRGQWPYEAHLRDSLFWSCLFLLVISGWLKTAASSVTHTCDLQESDLIRAVGHCVSIILYYTLLYWAVI